MLLAAASLSQSGFWIASRAAGTAALVLSSLAVCLGLLMGGRLLKGRGADLRAGHEALSLATLVAIVVHAGALLFDAFLHPSLLDLTVPFAFGYQRWWTALGIVAGWGLVALGLSFYARRHIGTARWRSVHRFAALAWLLGVAHSLGEGTDAGATWFLVMTAVAVVPALALLVVRHLPPRPAPSPPSRSPRRALPVEG